VLALATSPEKQGFTAMNRSAARALSVAAGAAARGDLWTAVDRLREALRSRERLGPQWISAVELAKQIGDDTGAVAAARRLYEEVGRTSASACVLAAVLTNAGDAAQAIALLRPLADAGQLTPSDTFKFTRSLMFAGEIEEAHGRARQLLRHEPDSPTLWERISQTKRFAPNDPDIDLMERAFYRWPESQPAGQAAIAAALAKAYVDIGDDDRADRYLEVKATANKARLSFDRRSLEAAVEDVIGWCERGGPDSAPAKVDGAHRPIFIVGAARSGTTLLDQVFSRHALVAGGGELPYFRIASCDFGDHRAAHVSSRVAGLRMGGTADPWHEIGRRYLTLASERFGAQGRFTDKLLSNVFRIRAIRQCLPDAPIVYLKRNPLDTAWSCWRAQLTADASWSTTPEGIVLYLGAVAKIMDAWKQRFPGAIHEVEYEELVRNPDVEVARLLAACGLPDDVATRQPELSNKAVMTLSFAEVRSPIRTSQVGAANAFPRASRRLRAALAAHGVS
jgi:hypothetical protein